MARAAVTGRTIQLTVLLWSLTKHMPDTSKQTSFIKSPLGFSCSLSDSLAALLMSGKVGLSGVASAADAFHERQSPGQRVIKGILAGWRSGYNDYGWVRTAT